MFRKHLNSTRQAPKSVFLSHDKPEPNERLVCEIK